jgi:7-cyano-7-deazaguanine synthase
MLLHRKTAVILFSGGLDSTTVLQIASDQGFEPYCLSFNYGQKQSIELVRAKEITRALGIKKHMILSLDLNLIGGSALTTDTPVPKNRDMAEMEEKIPVTYVPGRNIIFLSHALAWAEVLESRDIFIGINAVDYSGYPDCRPDFLEAFVKMANLGTKAGSEGHPFRLHAPLIKMSKKEIIQTGIRLGVDYKMTHSCYDPVGELPCGCCDACLLRLKGFSQAGRQDPARYSP